MAAAPETLTDRLVEGVTRSQKYLPRELADRVAAIFTPQAIAMMAGGLALWAASHAVGIGFAVDVLLLSVAAFQTGFLAARVAQSLWQFVSIAADAKTDADLELAAQWFARAILDAGVTAVSALLLRFGASRVTQPRPPTAVGGGVEVLERVGDTTRVAQTLALEQVLVRVELSGGRGADGMSFYRLASDSTAGERITVAALLARHPEGQFVSMPDPGQPAVIAFVRRATPRPAPVPPAAPTGLGDLTATEVQQIQAIVELTNARIVIGGSAARGLRRNPTRPDLPLGKGPNMRSDIDYYCDAGSFAALRQFYERLPALDQAQGVVKISSENLPLVQHLEQGPSIVFMKGQPPRWFANNRYPVP